MAQYVDAAKFRSTVRLEGPLTEGEPSVLGAVALAVWLRCTASTSVAA
ncbi:MAG: hypothetical protein ACRD3C_16500 [Vicinamibacterales bacterium]